MNNCWPSCYFKDNGILKNILNTNGRLLVKLKLYNKVRILNNLRRDICTVQHSLRQVALSKVCIWRCGMGRWEEVGEKVDHFFMWMTFYN